MQAPTYGVIELDGIEESPCRIIALGVILEAKRESDGNLRSLRRTRAAIRRTRYKSPLRHGAALLQFHALIMARRRILESTMSDHFADIAELAGVKIDAAQEVIRYPWRYGLGRRSYYKK